MLRGKSAGSRVNPQLDSIELDHFSNAQTIQEVQSLISDRIIEEEIPQFKPGPTSYCGVLSEHLFKTLFSRAVTVRLRADDALFLGGMSAPAAIASRMACSTSSVQHLQSHFRSRQDGRERADRSKQRVQNN
jgi:hypothetical protein